MAEKLCLASFAGCDSQQRFKNLMSYVLEGTRAVSYPASVYIHVVRHAPKRIGIAADLERRHGWKADRASASSCKGDEIDAPSGKTRKRNRIVSRGVHKNETLSSNALGVTHDIFQR